MPDRVIRDELLQSSRWLDLPTDTHRLIYENLILIADDYGNIEGGPRRLFRWMHGFTQVKTESDAIKIMSDLQDADLARRYESEGREYWHLPRFKNSRWYWTRRYPQSPYVDDVTVEGKQRNSGKRNTQVDDASLTRTGGVGVGVGVGEDKTKRAQGEIIPGLPRAWWKTNEGIDKAIRVLEVRVNPLEGYEDAKRKCFDAIKDRYAKSNA